MTQIYKGHQKEGRNTNLAFIISTEMDFLLDKYKEQVGFKSKSEVCRQVLKTFLEMIYPEEKEINSFNHFKIRK